MKKIVGNSVLHLYLVSALLVSLFAGCRYTDLDSDSDSGTYTGGDAEMTLTLAVPGVSSASRAMNGSDEYAIKEIDALVFNEDGTFQYHVHGFGIGDPGVENRFKVTLKVGTNRQSIVVFANLRNSVSMAIGKFTTKAGMIGAVTLDTPQKWNSATSAFTPLPMWGESGKFVVSQTSTALDSPITMLRSVAKVDIGLKFNATGDGFVGLGDAFKLQEINVHYPVNKVQAAPNTPNYNATDKIVTAPSIPIGAGRAAKYSYPLSSNGLIGDIYIAESTNNPNNNNDRTCFVIKGDYNKSGTSTWYRIDFYNGTAFYNVLRNHRYKINITSVDGPGYPTEDDALKSAPMNITSNIVVWNEGGSDVVYDGQHSLSVSKDSMVMYNDRVSDVFTVATTNPIGWQIKTTRVPSGTTTAEVDGLFNPKESATTAMSRVSLDYPAPLPAGMIEFDIVSGNLTKKMKINVLNDASPGPITGLTLPEVFYFANVGGNVRMDVTTNIAKVDFIKNQGLLNMTVGPIADAPKSRLVTVSATSITTSPNGLISGSVDVDVFASNATIKASTRIVQYITPLNGRVDILQMNKDNSFTPPRTTPLDWDAKAFRSVLRDQGSHNKYVFYRKLLAPAFTTANELYFQTNDGQFSTSPEITNNRSYVERTVAETRMHPASSFRADDSDITVKDRIIPVIGHTVVPKFVMQAGKPRPTISLPVSTDVIAWDATTISKTLSVVGAIDQEIDNLTLHIKQTAGTGLISGNPTTITNSKTSTTNASPEFALVTTPYRDAAPGSANRVVDITASYRGFGDGTDQAGSGTWTIGQPVAPRAQPQHLRIEGAAGNGKLLEVINTGTDLARLTINIPNTEFRSNYNITGFNAAQIYDTTTNTSPGGVPAGGHSFLAMNAAQVGQFRVECTANTGSAKTSDVYYTLNTYNKHVDNPQRLHVRVVQAAAAYTIQAEYVDNNGNVLKDGFYNQLIPTAGHNGIKVRITTTDPAGWKIDGIDAIEGSTGGEFRISSNGLIPSALSGTSASETITIKVAGNGDSQKWREGKLVFKGKTTPATTKATMWIAQDYGLLNYTHIDQANTETEMIYLGNTEQGRSGLSYNASVTFCNALNPEEPTAIGGKWRMPNYTEMGRITERSGDRDVFGFGNNNNLFFLSSSGAGELAGVYFVRGAVGSMKYSHAASYIYKDLATPTDGSTLKVRCVLILPKGKAPGGK